MPNTTTQENPTQPKLTTYLQNGLHGVLSKSSTRNRVVQTAFDTNGASTFLDAVQEEFGVSLEKTEERLKILSSIDFRERKRLTNLLAEIKSINREIFTNRDNSGEAVVDVLIRLAKDYMPYNLHKGFFQGLIQSFRSDLYDRFFPQLVAHGLVTPEDFLPFIKLMDSFTTMEDRKSFMVVFNQLSQANTYQKKNRTRHHKSDNLLRLLLNLQGKSKELGLAQKILKDIASTEYLKRHADQLFSQKQNLETLTVISEITQLLAKAKLINYRNLTHILHQPDTTPQTLYSIKSLNVHYQLLYAINKGGVLTQDCLDQLQDIKVLAQSSTATIHHPILLNFIPMMMRMSTSYEDRAYIAENINSILQDVRNILSYPNSDVKFLKLEVIKEMLFLQDMPIKTKETILNSFLAGTPLVSNGIDAQATYNEKTLSLSSNR